MRYFKTSLTSVAFTAAALALFAGCGSSDSPTSTPGGTAGATSSGSVAGSSPGGGSPSTTAHAGSAGTNSSAAGSIGAGGAAPSGGGASPAGGGASPAGGAAPAGGGSSPTAGAAGTSTAGGASGDVDQGGKGLAAPGDTTSTVQDYLRIGEIRLLNNNWGSQAVGCTAPKSTMSVFVNTDKSFGWKFDRGACAPSDTSHPDFPQIEFGIHPFGIGSSLATSPNFSSTTLLPLQIKDITSASVKVDGLQMTLDNAGSWDLTFEFWLSQQNPATSQMNAGVYSELMTFWGWQSGRWPSAPGADGSQTGGKISSSGGSTADTVNAGKTYTLWVQEDTWASGWRYYQFRDNNGPGKTFNGTLDIKALIDYLVNSRGFSKDLWVTRFEIGTEIDDGNKGSVSMQGVTFEVNKQTRSQVFKAQ